MAVSSGRLSDSPVAVEPRGDGRIARRDLAPLIVVGQVVVAVAVRAAVFARPLATLDRLFVPDDTYYTLTIARSMAHGLGPTTDGHTLTSGFQPLLGFLMVPVFWFTHNADVGLRADMALLLAADVGVVVLLFWLGRRLAGLVGGAVAGFIWALSPNAISMAIGGLETTLAVFAALGLVVVWLHAWDRPSRGRWVAVGVVAGLGVLARIDVLALVAALGFVQLLWGRRRELIPAAVGMAVTLAPWWGYCIAEFGTPFPTSGSATRAVWLGGAFSRGVMAAAGTAVVVGPFTAWSKLEWHLTVRQVVWPYWVAIAAFVALGGIAIGGALRRHERRRRGQVPPSLWAGALCAWAAALLVFYGWFNVAAYTHRYLMPVTAVEALLLGWAASALVAGALRAQEPLRVPAVSLAAVVLLVGLAGALTASTLGLGRLWRIRSLSEVHYLGFATGYRAPALFAARVVPDRVTIGAMQSGASSYYAKPDTVVVNLDGVVNPDATRARTDGTLGDYIHRRRIRWFADGEIFLVEINLALARARPPTHVVPVAKLPGTLSMVATLAPGPAPNAASTRSTGSGPQESERP